MSNDTQPEIRFPGFTEDWELRKLGEILVLLKDGTHGTHKDVDEGMYLLSAKNIKNGKINIDESDRIISEDEYKSIHKNFNLEKGDVLLTIVGSIGEAAVLENPFKLTFQRSVAYLRPNGTLTSQFLYTTIMSTKFQRELKKRQVVSAQPGIYLGDLSMIPIELPCMEEQQKIGTFFKQLDDTITLHQRKLDLLKETKKGFLQKMFPKNGAKVPEIRFPGFTGDWEERKLGEVVVFLNGRAFKQQELLDSGKYRVLRVGNFNTNDRWYYSNLELEEDKYANKGDLLYLWATSFGPEMWNEERVIYHYHIWKLKFLSKELDKQYLYTWLLTDKEKIKESTNGTTMVHVTKGGIEQRTFQFPPDINEQQKIGAFFKQLDDTIALHQRKLDLL
ncbi:restriction endonuclease subunit S, partial [Enterococcus faecium]|uniref:restriction endonuclease subunit S n=1 Tax=Enterococcus faecium TaxID=1352 RepID=UPI0010BF8367